MRNILMPSVIIPLGIFFYTMWERRNFGESRAHYLFAFGAELTKCAAYYFMGSEVYNFSERILHSTLLR